MSRRIFTFIALTVTALSLLVSTGCEQPSGEAAATETVSQTGWPEPSAAPVMYTGPEETSPPEPTREPEPAPRSEETPEPAPTLLPEETPEPAPTFRPEETPEPAPTPRPEETPQPVPTPRPEETPEPASEPTPEPTPKPAPRPTPNPSESTYTGPDLVECEPVGDEFFAGTAFFGNSLVDGLRYFGGLNTASFYAATSASVVNVEVTLNSELESGEECTLFDALTEKNYGKIYILLGINEISFEPDYFCWLYGGLLDRIRVYEPSADIYIMSLSPVTEKCSQESEFFNMERITAYNSALYDLAREKECYYVDLCQALAGEDGYLPEEVSTEDGIHLIREEYPHWSEYLRTHIPPAFS